MIANYKLIRKLGTGDFCEVFEGIDLKANISAALKLEPVNARHPQLLYETKIYQYLHKDITAHENGIPKIYTFVTQEENNVMAIELLGPNLEDLFNICGRRFSRKTVLMLADQMLNCIEFVHSKGLLHRDIKPDNFVLGAGSKQHKIYLIDFGLSKKFLTKDQSHIPYKEGKTLTGTARYASVNTHSGIEQGRRDDLECLGYTMMYFLRGGLPWQNQQAANKAEKQQKIFEKKTGTPLEELCIGFPSELKAYLRYCRNLKFEEKPDYDCLRKLFKDLFVNLGYERDYVYDWNLLARSRTESQFELSRREERKDEEENNQVNQE